MNSSTMDDRDIKDNLNVTTGQDKEEGDDELTPTNTIPTLESGSSFADSETAPTKSEAPTSPWLTSKKGILGLFTPKPSRSGKKLSSLYKGEGDPSPPKVGGQIVDMELLDVDSRVRQLGFLSFNLDPEDEWYKKLAFLIGKGLDEEVQKREPWRARFTLGSLLNPRTPMGQRFEAMYRSNGDKLSGCRDGKAPGWQAEWLQENIPQLAEEGSYLIFNDQEEHSNLEYFDREQIFGNCFAHGPALWLWYLTLWKNSDLSADDAPLIDISKFIRNTYSAGRLYDYLVLDKGGSAFDAAEEFVPGVMNYSTTLTRPVDFEGLKRKLKEQGPGLVEVPRLHSDFQEEGRVKYKGAPLGTVEGHAMVLVGVFQDHTEPSGMKERNVYLLLQNFWQNKPFVAVSQEYLVNSGTKIYFMDKDRGLEPRTDQNYLSKTNTMRHAITSPGLERPVEMVYLRN